MPPVTERPPSKGKWSPPNDQVAGRMEALADKYKLIEQLNAECKAELGALVNNDGVPIAALAERYNIQRKTIYRHIGRMP